MTSASSGVLRLALALVALASPVVPRARRAAWRRQWDADLRHQWAFLTVQRSRPAAAIDLVGRALGAWRHALILQSRSWSLPMFLSDVRYGARMLLQRPTFSMVAILLLGLGIGANTTIYSWVSHFVLQPLPGVVRADEIVSVHGTTLTRRDISYSYPNFADTRERMPDSLAGMTGFRQLALNVRTGAGDPERAWGELVTADFFSVFGVNAHLGRTLVADDDRAPGASPVVVLSHGYWQRRFGADPGVVGSQLTINGTAFTVVGVADPEFRGAMPAMSMDLWVPMMMQQAVYAGERLTQRGNAWLTVYARLAPGASIEQAQAGLSQVAAGLAEEFPDVNEDRGAAVYPLWRDPQSSTSTLAPVMGVLFVVVGLVLLIVCANLANLMLARANDRQREMAVRLALGAGRLRLIRQLLTEYVLLAFFGGVVGTVVALWARQAMGHFVPPTPLPVSTNVPFDWSLPVFSFGLALVTVMFFGLLPALQTSRPHLMPVLRDARGVVGGSRRWLRQALVVVQVATSIILLVGAGLFIRTLQHANDADVGFDLEQGMLASIDLLPGGYEAAEGRILLGQLLDEVHAMPGVVSAAIARDIPLKMGGGSDTTVEVEGYQPAEGEELTTFYDRVTPEFFETLGLPLVAGRVFTDRDTPDTPPVIVVNETMARRWFPAGDAVGRRVQVGEWHTVIGVVGDATYTTLSAPPVSYMYLPFASYYRPDVTLIVRTATDPAAVMQPVRDAMKRLDPNIPLFDVRTFAEHREIAVFIPRLAATLLGMFGTLALVLASVGLYGLLAFSVGQRTPEIGVRLALGAQRGDILNLVVWQGIKLTAIGAATGIALALVALPLLSTQLVGTSPRDVMSFTAAALLLMLGAAAASYVPARRAASVDPIRALRYE